MICLVTNRKLCIHPFLRVIEEALRERVDAIILREKDLSPLELFHLALDVKLITDRFQTPLIINTSVEVAAAVGAAGVHLGFGSLPIKQARKILGLKLIGRSVHSTECLATAGAENYLITGHIFDTRSKSGPPKGLGFLREICRLSPVPVVAIGGITPSNILDVFDAGARGAAVMSYVMAAEDPRRAVWELKSALAGRNGGAPFWQL